MALCKLNVTKSGLQLSTPYYCWSTCDFSLLPSSSVCSSGSVTGFPLAALPSVPTSVGLILFTCVSCLLLFFADAVHPCMLYTLVTLRTVRLDTPHNWALFWTDGPPICAPTIWPLTKSVSSLILELDGCVDSWMDVLTVYSEGLSRWSCSLCGVPFILSTEKLMEKGKTKKHQKSPFWTLCSFQKQSFNYMQRQMFRIWAHTTTMWQLQTLPVAGRNPLNTFFLSQQPLWHEIVDKHVCY